MKYHFNLFFYIKVHFSQREKGSLFQYHRMSLVVHNPSTPASFFKSLHSYSFFKWSKQMEITG